MRNRLPLFSAITVYIIFSAVIFLISFKINDGNFVYALDDTYIHMSMAKNLVATGNFATNQLSFASASSSPLWVLIISAVYFITGLNLLTPFILNLIFQILTIAVINLFLKKYGISRNMFFYLLLIVLITPFPAVLFTGMEHSIQIFLAVVFIVLSLNIISGEQSFTGYDNYLIILSAFFFGGIRYEDLIFILLVTVLLFIKRKKVLSAGVLLFGSAPLLIYGIFSLSKGGLFLPNTLLLKSSLPAFNAAGSVKFITKAIGNITEPHILSLLILLSTVYLYNFRKGIKFWELKQLLIFTAVSAIFINMAVIEYNHNGSFYRYDAYLVTIGLFALVLNVQALKDDLKRYYKSIRSVLLRISAVIILLASLSPLFIRIFTAAGILHASMEYYKQQYQMAQFCKTYAGDMTIALNDIGMVNYYTDNKILDLLGLSDTEITKHRINRTYSTSVIDSLSRKYNVRLAICYSHWFDEYGGLPRTWKKIAEWTMTDENLYLGNSTVDIFITQPEDEKSFRDKLVEYSSKLPNTVLFELKK